MWIKKDFVLVWKYMLNLITYIWSGGYIFLLSTIWEYILYLIDIVLLDEFIARLKTNLLQD